MLPWQVAMVVSCLLALYFLNTSTDRSQHFWSSAARRLTENSSANSTDPSAKFGQCGVTRTSTSKCGGGDFPPDLLISCPYSRSNNKAFLVFHILGMVQMFAGLSVVCDEYFVSALEVMIDEWKITEDVAGATFMAAGGSAPELFTSVIGVFVAQNDVGFGTIVGSAVFNVLFVIGLCAIFARQTLVLTWWPLARDCTYYLISLVVLTFFVANDSKIWWSEALILFILYIGYCVVMKFNTEVKALVLSL